MKYYIIDAFADELFKGNPAGVCLLEEELPEAIMQNIAFENNLAETAFLLKKENKYHLRWFTPDVEIDLCGHATLATAYVMMTFVDPNIQYIEFESKSGTLSVKRVNDILLMDFPNRKPVKCEIPAGLEDALGCRVLETQLSRDLLVFVENESIVKNLQPDIDKVSKISSDISFALIVTSEGEHCDFVSRFFAPNAGIIEDPVTGSSHCTLIPYWNEKLNKTDMVAKQLSKRGGTLYCKYLGERVEIGGKAICYLQGDINI